MNFIKFLDWFVLHIIFITLNVKCEQYHILTCTSVYEYDIASNAL